MQILTKILPHDPLFNTCIPKTRGMSKLILLLKTVKMFYNITQITSIKTKNFSGITCNVYIKKTKECIQTYIILQR